MNYYNYFLEKLKNKIKQSQGVRIYKRLDNLWKYTKLFNFETDKLCVLEKSINDILFEFNSTLGTVRIRLIHYFTYDEDILLEDGFKLEYSNYAGSTVFRIDTIIKKVIDIVPMLGEDLTAKDIDLAIYELEEYLFKTYGDIEEAWKKDTEYKKFQIELHKQQVKELESWEISKE